MTSYKNRVLLLVLVLSLLLLLLLVLLLGQGLVLLLGLGLGLLLGQVLLLLLVQGQVLLLLLVLVLLLGQVLLLVQGQGQWLVLWLGLVQGLGLVLWLVQGQGLIRRKSASQTKQRSQYAPIIAADTAITNLLSLMPSSVSVEDRAGMASVAYETCREALEVRGLWHFRQAFFIEIVCLIYLIVYYRLVTLLPKQHRVPL